MPLFLLELPAQRAGRAEIGSCQDAIAATVKQSGGEVIEAQVATAGIKHIEALAMGVTYLLFNP